ncbi:hypothetical protein N7494_012185 [Penicillium frequentans]|uniref:DNA-binding protein RAP1 n=1 Tax=Penicillium frequentans TaxID=3151616 RepID=A0AAD6CLC1_9EURO|nr:hypothetical protein N7494_012185 [Penicillium glabrum]
MATPGQDMPDRNLFDDKKFWLSHYVPRRTMLKEMIKSHGGTVVEEEKSADIKIVDHRQKNLPADSYSYQFVERSVQNGKREDIEPYRAGPSAQRPVGASHIPRKTTRTEYTLKDDQILFDWLHPYELEGNAPTSGNSIYKELAEKFPHHTYQSWRSRYLKNIRGRPRPGGGEPKPDLSIRQDPRLPLHPAAELALGPVSSRIPTTSKQKVPPKPSQSRPSDQDHTKRKRASTGESPSHRRSEKGPSSPKRRLMETSEAMDSMAHNISNKRGTKPRGSPMRLSSRLSSSPATSSKASRTHQNPPPQQNSLEATTPSRPAPPQNDTKPEQNQAIQSQNKASSMVNPLFLEMPFPPTPEPEQNQGTQPQNGNNIVNTQLPTVSLPPPNPLADQNQAVENEADMIMALLLEKPSSLANPNTEHIQAAQSLNETNKVNALLLEMPFYPSSPEPESEPEQDKNENESEHDQEIHPDIDSWIDARLARGDVELPVILEALQSTSMNPEYAELVLEQFAAGKGIPHDMPGVWTAEDDKCLQGGDQRDIERLFKTHGEELCEARYEFLRLMSD